MSLFMRFLAVCAPLAVLLAGCESPTKMDTDDPLFDEILAFMLDDNDGYTADEGDCDVVNPNIHPGAPDFVGDDVDSNCDGVDGIDADQDTYASIASGGDDCDDNDATINPAAVEVEFDGIDQNCDGVDDGFIPQHHYGDLTITSIAQMTAFCEVYDVVEGNLYINGCDVTEMTEISCLTEVYGSIYISGSNLTSITLPNLTYVGGSISFYGNEYVTTIDLPLLAEIDGDMTISSMYLLETIEFASLTNICGYIYITYNELLVSASLPVLVQAGGLSIYENEVFVDLLVPLLATIDENFYVSYMSLIELIDAPSVTTIGGLLSIGSCSLLADIQFPVLAGAGSISISSLDLLIDLSFPSLTSVTENIKLTYLYYLESLDFSVLSSVGGLELSYLGELIELDFPALLGVTDIALITAWSTLETVNFPVLSAAGTFQLINSSSVYLVDLSLPALVTVVDKLYISSSYLQTLDLPQLTSTGIFYLATSGMTGTLDLPLL
ncbi:MAG: hypothetical protein HN348_15950, partial [Proteobacteria bacterium]|nr:hypothetical protein [Pseudomonadota bacterium]